MMSMMEQSNTRNKEHTRLMMEQMQKNTAAMIANMPSPRRPSCFSESSTVKLCDGVEVSIKGDILKSIFLLIIWFHQARNYKTWRSLFKLFKNSVKNVCRHFFFKLTLKTVIQIKKYTVNRFFDYRFKCLSLHHWVNKFRVPTISRNLRISRFKFLQTLNKTII